MGKKSKKHEGTIDDMSDEQQRVLDEILAWIRSENILDLDAILFDERDILRFCRARSFDVPKVRAMIQGFADWRRAEDIDTILETWEFPEEVHLKGAMR